MVQHSAYYDYESNRDVGVDCTQLKKVKSFDSLEDAEQWLSGIAEAYENLQSVRRNLNAYIDSNTRKSPIDSKVLNNLLSTNDITEKEYYKKYYNHIPNCGGEYQIYKEYCV